MTVMTRRSTLALRLPYSLGVAALLVWASGARAAAPPPPLCPYPGQTGLCTLATPVAPLLPLAQPKFVNELPQPVFYTPDKTTYPGFDYYVIESSPAVYGIASPVTPFGLASVSPAVPKPDTFTPGGTASKVWLGLCNPLALLTATGQCPAGQELYTEVWGYGQQSTAGAASALPIPAGKTAASTYPAMSFRATRGTPVKVKWVNNLPNQHLFCKDPLNSNWPCGIDRTIMGTLLPAGQLMTAAPGGGVYGGPQQPDNAMVIHLHGGEIPPDSDGFAELWFGNPTTAGVYKVTPTVGQTANIDPPFALPAGAGVLGASATTATSWNRNGTPTGDPASTVLGSLIRPTGSEMIYNYPMVQDAATIWYHDHALGKTRVNVAAGPAGYFYVQDPAVDTALWGAPSDAATGYYFGNCTNAGILAGACRDVPIVLQDRSFNADGSINFPNGLGQLPKNKNVNPLAPGVNPAVHPQWVPEYFGDSAVVNGITWPKLTVSPSAYRLRLLDGSNARCYTLSLTAVVAKGAVAPVLPTFNIIGSDQGYLPAPVASPTLTMCPGERYEVVVDFSGVAAGTIINLTNTAGAPFPAGPTPQAANSPYAQLASMMQFVVKAGTPAPWVKPANWTAAVTPTVITGGQALGFTYTAAGVQTGTLATAQAKAVASGAATGNPNGMRFLVLNEVLDPISKQPLRVQIDGKAFEAPVTETPKRGTVEVWQFINTTVDAHPMHLHLVQFKVVQRQAFDVNGYKKVNVVGFPPVVTKADPTLFLMGLPRPPDPGEEGFKDTAKSLPGEVLTVVAKWDGRWDDCDPTNPAATPFCKQAPSCMPYAGYTGPTIPATDPLLGTANTNVGCMCVAAVVPAGSPPACAQPIDAITLLPTAPPTPVYKPYFQPVSAGPYVWHCHIVDHEDNEMMRPSLVLP
jgi:FtsP/CotA-like multicopper oxidase with cupredoxin domain